MSIISYVLNDWVMAAMCFLLSGMYAICWAANKEDYRHKKRMLKAANYVAIGIMFLVEQFCVLGAEYLSVGQSCVLGVEYFRVTITALVITEASYHSDSVIEILGKIKNWMEKQWKTTQPLSLR